MSHLPDEVLACRAAAGKIEYFEEILARYRVRIYRLCYRMAGNAEDAEDWTQGCFVRVYQQLSGYDVARPFAPWLLRVASNTCVNLAKARSRRECRVQVGLSGAERSSPQGDPLERALAGAEAQELHQALDTLSPLLRQTLVLWAQEDLTFRELGEVLGVPLPTVSARVQRALGQLRDRILPGNKKVEP